MEESIVNKVAQSKLLEINLEEFYPKGERITFDLKDYLHDGLVLREKEYRAALNDFDWNNYTGKFVALFCSVDAIIPTWAFMLAATYLQPVAKTVVFGTLITLEEQLFAVQLRKLDLDQFIDKKVIVKGCSNIPVPESAFVQLTNLLRPVAQSIMFGEACSTVPLYKKK